MQEIFVVCMRAA